MTFYSLGRCLSSGTLPSAFKKTVYATLKNQIANLVPTTYDASKAYLDQELLKPKGQRDLDREMCMLIVLQIPKDQDILLIAEATKMLIPLTNGCMLFYPTVELPPASFGTPENPYSDKLMDRKTSQQGHATIVLTYFTRVGDKLEYTGDMSNAVRLGFSPFE